MARSAWESSGSAPGSPATSRRASSTSPGSSRSPARRAGSLDRSLELVVGHRSEQNLVAGDRAGQLCMAGQPAVHVGAHADRHRAGERQQRVDERLPASGVVAQGEQLLELVDDHKLRDVTASVQPR